MLSFFSIFGIQNNRWSIHNSRIVVVNCFHFSVSLGYKTTKGYWKLVYYRLWIAFIFQYLWDTKQRKSELTKVLAGCELLSFFSIFGIQNNDSEISCNVLLVVNCFHFSVSLGYKTTFLTLFYALILLWIAFIFQYLWDTKQRTSLLPFCSECCELLSFFSIFGIQNNKTRKRDLKLQVVNCFHFSVSLGYKTTYRNNLYLPLPLWIAFIFQYLWDTKQQKGILYF